MWRETEGKISRERERKKERKKEIKRERGRRSDFSNFCKSLDREN